MNRTLASWAKCANGATALPAPTIGRTSRGGGKNWRLSLRIMASPARDTGTA